jgi:hypothetical protein
LQNEIRCKQPLHVFAKERTWGRTKLIGTGAQEVFPDSYQRTSAQLIPRSGLVQWFSSGFKFNGDLKEIFAADATVANWRLLLLLIGDA